MKKIFLVLFLLNFTLSISQNGKDNYFPPTPEANSLIKYVDVPVNYSTGATNYSIPIHTIKLKNLNIPITLSYQSSGLKPGEIASNVGLGWELSAGGKIVQNIAGKSDMEPYGALTNFGDLPNDRDLKLRIPPTGIYGIGNPIINQAEMDSIKAPGTDYTRLYDIDQYGTDTKPDLFYYSTPNKSGKFFFGNYFETKQIPFGKEKILYNNGSFEIIDTDGTRYIYNIKTENYNSVENVCQKFSKLNGTSNNSTYTFYLAQIVTPNNETVDFIYDTVKYSLVSDKDYTRYSHWSFGAGEKVTTFYSQITTKVLTKIKVNQDYEIEFLYNNYRKDIKGSVQATAPKTLDVIKIKYKNVIVDTCNFNYGYFGIADNEFNPSLFESVAINDDTYYRLKLKSFQKIGENPYVFSYYNEAEINRNVSCLDHWGYYSEACSSRYTVNTLFNDLGTTKAPNLEKTKTNVLSKVILPTKGEVEFNYELNTCSDCDISYPTYNWIPFAVYANTDDFYTGEEITNTVEFTVPKSITIPYIKFNLYSPGEATTTNNATAELYDDSNNAMNLQLTGVPGDNFRSFDAGGLIVGKKYKLVLKCYDTMENENKYVMVNFLTSEDVQSPISSVGGLRIKSIKTKDSNNYVADRSFDYTDQGKSSGILYEKPAYYDEYAYFDEGTNSDAPSLMIGLVSYAVQYSRIPSDLFGFNGYHIFYKKVTEKNNDVNDALNIIKTEKYFTFYDDIRYGEQTYFSKVSYNWKRGLPSQINEFDKSNIVRKTIFSYKFLDTPPGLNTSKYEVGFPLNNPTQANEFYKRGIDLSVYRRSLTFYNLYQYTNSRLISAWYYMDKKTTEETLNGNILKTEENYKYDNITHAQLTSQITTNSKGETLETKYYYPGDLLGEPLMTELNNANRISMPIATEQYKAGTLIFKNKTVYAKDATNNLILPKDLYSAKFPNSLPNISNVGNLEKKITYDQYDDKGNVLQYTPEGGTSVSIIWGYNKTLPIAKVENVAYSSIPAGTITNLQALSDADNDNCMSGSCTEQLLRAALNAFRDTFPNAFITTYTYNALVGVTSVTDPKALSSYYEYDTSGRLKFVKDKDLNILQKYCYNYKGQQVNCSDNTSTSVVYYKSIARSGSFTKNNCAAGGTGSSVSYSQGVGAYTSTISQADADNNGLTKFNTDGQANANTTGTCTFSSIARSGSFTKNNCASGGVGSSVAFSQGAGAQTSTVSQADADSKGLTLFNTNGQANANTNGTCTFSSIARSGSFTKNNCAADGAGSSVAFSQAAGAQTSTVSQADADSKGLILFNTNGQANANTNGTCTFSSIARSGSFTKDNCASGGVGSSVAFSQAAGAQTSTVSQVDADSKGLTLFNTNGQVNANSTGFCTFNSIARSGSFTKNNCASGGVGSSVAFSQVAGAQISTVSQATADSLGDTKFNTDGQAYANANGYCTFYSIARSGSFTKDNCASGGVGSSVAFSQAAGAQTSTVSQADADSKGLTLFNTNGQANANSTGFCTFSSIARSGSFTKNNCAAGGAGSSVAYNQVAGAQTSTVSQATADSLGDTKFNTDGQAYANANGYCTFYSVARSGSFAKNNCAAGGAGSSVGYNQAVGAQTSTVSQVDADSKGLTLFNTNGQANANSNGYCTFYSIARSGSFTKNNCPAGGVGSTTSFSQAAGIITSTYSQEDADYRGNIKFNTDGQNNANINGSCNFRSNAISGSFVKNNCEAGGTGSSVPYYFNEGVIYSNISQADADNQALALFNSIGQSNANNYGTCSFYNSVKSGTFTRNNCAGGTGSAVIYTVAAGAYSSTSSQAAADALAQSAVNNNGQAYANSNGICIYYSQLIVYQIYKNDYCPPGTTFPYVYYTVDQGAYQSTISQADADNKAWADVSANAQAYANANGRCLNPGETEE